MQNDILPIIKSSDQNLLILGKAGVGKSTLIKVIRKYFKSNCVVLCPTGIASQNVNGQTIHSFFNLPLKDGFDQRIINACAQRLKSNDRLQRLSEIETIIIDEISMVNSNVFDAINQILQTAFNTFLPFGGKRIILIGDIFQLPPVDKGGVNGDKIFFWRSKAFKLVNFHCLELKKVYRLSESKENQKFESILEKIRLYNSTQLDLDFLNQKIRKQNTPVTATILCTTKDKVWEYNSHGLKRLNNPIVSFSAEKSKGLAHTDFPVEVELKISIDAPVIFVRNDPSGRFKNGTRGKVIDINESHKLISIQLENTDIISVGYIDLYTGQNDRLEQTTKIHYFKHFPLILGFAMTIHRCQGMTMSKVHLDLGYGTFVSGQLYVALSRLRDFNGLTLQSRLNFRDLINSKETLRFYQESKFEEVNLNLTQAEISSIDAQKEEIKTTDGSSLNSTTLSVHLFNQGLSIDEIIQERERLGLKQILPATIIGHLVKCYQEIDLAELREILEISKEFEQQILIELKLIKNIEQKELKEIKAELSIQDIDWNQLKFIAYVNGFIVPELPKKKNKEISKEIIVTPKPKGEVDKVLLEKLKKLRNKIAEENDVPAYLVFNNNSLEEMAVLMPSSEINFLNVKGVGPKKNRDYGDEFLSLIRQHNKSPKNNIDNDQLFNELKKLRKEIAVEKSVPAFVVFSDTTLQEMAEKMPSNKREFIELKGVGQMKLQEYGDQFLRCIADYLN